MYIILAILLFGLLILVHELGHYLTARLFGVAINEFSIGMGPKIFSWTSKKTAIAYSLRALPIGGYVSMAGEDEESDNPNAFDKKPVWQRMIITVAGSASNLLLAFVVMFVLVASTPQLGSTQISKFRDGAVSPSYDLQVGDVITEINGNKVHISRELGYYISRYGTEPVDITLMRGGEKKTLTGVVFAVATDDETGYVYGKADFFVNPERKNIGTVIKNGFFEDSADDAAEIIRRFSPEEPVTVIGCSAGALIAMCLASKYPELVSLAIIHEPPTMAFLPENHEAFEIADKINAFVAARKIGRGATKFLLLMDNGDENAKPKSEEAMLQEEENMRFFIEHEFAETFTKELSPEIPKKVKSVFCAGDAHREDFIYKTTQMLAENSALPFIRIAGKHNCAYDLPMEFASAVEGIISVM